MRRAALIAGVLALLGAAGLYLFRPAAGPVADATAHADPGATPTPPSLQAAPTPAGIDASRASARAGEATEDGAEPSIGAGTSDDPVVCRLTFLGEGPRPSKVDLKLQPRDGSQGPVRRRATPDAWEVRIPRAPGYSVSLTLDGWESNQEFRDERPTEDDRLELEVRLPRHPSIFVVDEGTGTALPEGMARRVGGGDTFMEDRPAPGPDSLTTMSASADAAGTILLAFTAQLSDWWIGAPGHAWARVRVSPDDVERRVALSPGGALRVVVEGALAGGEALVSANPAEEKDRRTRQAVLARDAATGRHWVEGLPPGRWVLSVGPTADIFVRETWATAEVDVVAGRTTDARLVVPPRDPKSNRTVEFELVVPAGWTERPNSVHVRGCAEVTDGIDRLLDVPENAPLPWRVEVAGLRDGPYQVEVGPYGWSTLARVRRGTTVIRVEVPAPVAVRIRMLDEKDGKPLSGANACVVAPYPWDSPDNGSGFLEGPPDPVADESAKPTSWSTGGTPLREGEEAGSYDAQVFAGQVRIAVDVDGYLSEMLRVSIPASATVFEHVIRLSRGGRIEVRVVRDGKTFEAAEGELHVAGKRDDEEAGDSLVKATGAAGGKASFDGLPPGTYVVSWHRSGFGRPATATKEVTLRAGGTVRVDLEAPPLPK